MSDSTATTMLPEVPGDNPPLPDKCPVCGAGVEATSVFHVRYVCGAVYAPLRGLMPTVWGGSHAAPGQTAPEVDQLDPTALPAGVLNPTADQSKLNAALVETIRIGMLDAYVVNTTDPVQHLADSIEKMLTTGIVPGAAQQ